MVAEPRLKIGFKPSPAAIRRRQQKVRDWSGQGYWVDQIARCLRPEVSEATVSADRAAMGTGRTPHGRNPKPDPEPFDWLAEPAGESRPAYLLNAPMQRVEAFLLLLRDMNSRAKLPYNIAEARAAGDDEWFTHSQAVLIDTIRYLQDMLDIMQEDEARKAALQPEARDDLTPLQRHRRKIAELQGKPLDLTAKGDGVLPARVYQVLMAWHWAGADIEGDEVAASISKRENMRRGRIALAAAQLKPALESAGWD